MSSYDDLAEDYEAWIGHNADVAFYVGQARASGGPVVELGVGTGRIAIPTAEAGVRVIGVDASQRMLDICRRRATDAGVADRLDLRHGDFRSPPVAETVPIVTCPRLSFLHLQTDADRRRALDAIRRILQPGGRFVFDVFAPLDEDNEPPRVDWIERAPGLWTKDDYDWGERSFQITIRKHGRETKLRFHWLTRDEWRGVFDDCGFDIYACYGWFDLSPCGDGIYSVWSVQRRD